VKAIRRLARLAPAAVLPLPLAGCAGWQSALDPHGPGAAALARLIWIFTGVSVVVWVLVMIALALAVGSRRALPPPGDPLAVDPGHDRRAALVITFAIGVTFIILLVLTGLSYSAQKTITEPQPNELSIRVTGYQWWWDVRYEDADASRTFTTANEIHVPVGRPVRLTLGATDVIHSFWVPNLTGKMDLVPGRQNELRLTADRAGVYRGQCSEYCGYQHAHMGILVVADPPEEFEAWRNRQIAAAEAPADPLRQKGMELFLSRPCVVCHSVRGTPAGSRGGPDLTHVGSRRSIAAGMLPTNRGTLAAWIADPQGIKPGSKMPTMELQADEINAIAAYLEGLK
jgi:cytochrome c oxidase subunit 2